MRSAHRLGLFVNFYYRWRDERGHVIRRQALLVPQDGLGLGRLKTSVPGVFVLKMPAYKTSPARLAIELNPTDESGAPTKKRGLS